MASLPQLTEEDTQLFDIVLNDLLAKTEASLALLVEKAGYRLHEVGDGALVDTTTFSTLASNTYNAAEFMAQMIAEPQFTGLYQQGVNYSTLILSIDESCLLVIVFKAGLSVGMVRFYGATATKQLGDQLVKAGQRDPSVKIDLVDLNASDFGELFRKKEA
jgi:predicted regulator of Ras-like GTPase activity (Roadblock/LC7/MglB family)